MKGTVRHRIIKEIARRILDPFIKARFRFTYERVRPRHKPYILIANHTCVYDPILIGFSFRDPLYYVASDHLFRLGLLSSLLVFAVAPIPRAKSTTETKTVMEIYRHLKEGLNVCIFAEGNSTFSGETGYIPPSIGKLARRTGASLITYRIIGGYFSLPRWSHNVRKGRLRGYAVHEYTPGELREMTDDGINEAVARDLYVNAYDEQEKDPVAYRGDRLAEHLEYALYCCPRCRNFSTLHSSGDRLRCDCGLDLRYTEYGYLEPYDAQSGEAPFRRVLDWFRWQKGMIRACAAEALADPACAERPVFSDDGQILIRTVRARRNKPVAEGTVDFYRDRMVLRKNGGGEIVFRLAEIPNMSVIIQMNLIFSTEDGVSYELHSDHPRSALKYLDLYRELLGRPETV